MLLPQCLTVYDLSPCIVVSVCDCYSPGSVGTSCDYRTGQCSCRGHFAGQRCHRCQVGKFVYFILMLVAMVIHSINTW